MEETEVFALLGSDTTPEPDRRDHLPFPFVTSAAPVDTKADWQPIAIEFLSKTAGET